MEGANLSKQIKKSNSTDSIPTIIKHVDTCIVRSSSLIDPLSLAVEKKTLDSKLNKASRIHPDDLVNILKKSNGRGKEEEEKKADRSSLDSNSSPPQDDYSETFGSLYAESDASVINQDYLTETRVFLEQYTKEKEKPLKDDKSSATDSDSDVDAKNKKMKKKQAKKNQITTKLLKRKKPRVSETMTGKPEDFHPSVNLCSTSNDNEPGIKDAWINKMTEEEYQGEWGEKNSSRSKKNN